MVPGQARVNRAGAAIVVDQFGDTGISSAFQQSFLRAFRHPGSGHPEANCRQQGRSG